MVQDGSWCSSHCAVVATTTNDSMIIRGNKTKLNTKSLETETSIKTGQQIGIHSNPAKMRSPAIVPGATKIFQFSPSWDALGKTWRPCFTYMQHLTLYKAFPSLLLHLLFTILWKGKMKRSYYYFYCTPRETSVLSNQNQNPLFSQRRLDLHVC